MSGWKMALRIAVREARASRFKFLFVIFGVAAGVGALTGVRGFSSAFQTLLLSEARTLMAADLTVRVFSPPNEAQEKTIAQYTGRGAALTRITETVSMLSAGETVDPVLVSVKAVDPAQYPFYGQVRLDPAAPLPQALAPDTIAISDDLQLRLSIGPGSTVKLGDTALRVVGVTKAEPDRMTGSLNVGPRVLISRAALEKTGLMTLGSRASQRLLFRLPAQGVDVGTMRKDLKQAFPESMIADYREVHPAITRALDRSTTFLSLVSLIALIVGALGVATAIHAHLQQRLDSIAILKCLGARSGQVIRIYTLQAALLGLLGGLAGVTVGAMVQQLFPLLLRKYFQIEKTIIWSPAFALEGIGIGLLVSMLFTLPPLLSIRRIRPALIFRREMAEVRPGWFARLRQAWPAAVAGLVIFGGLASVAGWLAESLKMGAYFILGIAGALLALSAVAWLLLKGLRLVIRAFRLQLPVAVRQGLMNLYRPGNHAGSVLVALGTGVMFTVTIYLVQKSILTEVINTAPPGMPNVFMINITEREREGIQKLLDGVPGLAKRPQITGVVSVRLETIDGARVRDRQLKGFGRRLAQTRQVSWAAALPEDLEVRKGAWWKAEETAPLVSVSEEAAEVLQLQPGQKLEWSAQGRTFTAKIAAVHRQRTAGMGPGVEFMFTRAALEGLPVQYFAGVRLPNTEVAKFQRQAYQQYPTVTVINVADVITIVQEVVDQVALLVRFISAFAILAGAIILASTVAGTRMRRMRETAILKTLGARRGALTGIFSVEFVVIGGVAGLMGGVLGTAFSRLLLTRLLDASFRFEPWPNAASVVLTAGVAVLAGWLASARILGLKPLEVLRAE